MKLRIAFTILCASGLLPATVPEWRTRMEQAIALRDSGSPRAEQEFQEASAIAGAVADKGVAKAIVASHFSVLLIRQERYTEAERMLVDSIPVLEREPEHSVEHVAVLSNLAFLFRQTRRAEQALQHLIGAAAKAERAQPVNGFILLQILGNLALHYVERQDLDRARPILAKARSYESHPSVANHPSRVPLLLASSEFHILRGEPKLARDESARAVRIIEQNHRVGPSELSAPLHQLARAEMDLGHLTAAEQHWKRSLGILREQKSRDYPHLASILLPLASLARVQRRFAECEELLREAGRIAELSRQSYVTGVVQHEMALLNADRNKHEQAEPLFRSSLALTASTVGKQTREYANCLLDFSNSLTAQRRYADAEGVLRESIETIEALRLPQNSAFPLLLDRHAQLLQKLKRKEEAKHVQARAKGLRSTSGAAYGQTVDVLELAPKR